LFFLMVEPGGRSHKAGNTGIASGPCQRAEAVAYFLLYLGRTQVPLSLIIAGPPVR
jgi:hypothetical protein